MHLTGKQTYQNKFILLLNKGVLKSSDIPYREIRPILFKPLSCSPIENTRTNHPKDAMIIALTRNTNREGSIHKTAQVMGNRSDQ